MSKRSKEEEKKEGGKTLYSRMAEEEGIVLMERGYGVRRKVDTGSGSYHGEGVERSQRVATKKRWG